MDGDEDDDAGKVGSGQTETGHKAKASVNDSNFKSQEQAIAKKRKQTLISKLWTTSSTSASPVNSPRTSPLSSPRA